MPTGEIYAQKRIIPNVVEQYKTMGWLPNGAINATSKGIGLTGQMIAHPLLTAGAIGGGVAAYKMGNLGGGYDRSPTLTGQTTGGVGVRANYDQQAMAAELMTTQMAPTGDIGGAGQMYGAQAQRSFMGSTMGLVQGLSRSRH
jgi:hypothetical protein